MQDPKIRLSELISALSIALDMAEGQPDGHSLRTCWIGMHLAEAMGISAVDRHDLYYVLLLKDLGGSANAAQVAELYKADDRRFKQAQKLLESGGVGSSVRFALKLVRLQTSLPDRFRALWRAVSRGEDDARELIVTRSERGAAIAARLRLPREVQEGVRSLDEHWDGQGQPQGLAGEAIPLFSRIALLCQVVERFHHRQGLAEALEEARRRSGSWFDPALVDKLCALAEHPTLWAALPEASLWAQVLALAPVRLDPMPDDEHLDDIARAFGEVIDSKSRYSGGHSERVSRIADSVAEDLGLDPHRRLWLRRAAQLHDLGKLGVSTLILDKPGKLDEREWAEAQAQARRAEAILSQIPAFSRLARLTGAHSQSGSDKGSSRSLRKDPVGLDARILGVADVFDAMTSPRSHRPAMPVQQALECMHDIVNVSIDLRCFQALERAIARHALDDVLQAQVQPEPQVQAA